MLTSERLGLIVIVVSEYDPAISSFVDVVGFGFEQDSAALANDGRPKLAGGSPAARCGDRPAACAGAAGRPRRHRHRS